MANTKTTKVLQVFTIIISIIAILTFAGTVLAWTYEQGEESRRMDILELRQDKSEEVDKIIFKKIDANFTIGQNSVIKLDLLLDYFHITDSTRHY